MTNLTEALTNLIDDGWTFHARVGCIEATKGGRTLRCTGIVSLIDQILSNCAVRPDAELGLEELP